jgi:hypothetical protein
MKPGPRFLPVFLMPVLLVLECCAWSCADDSEIAQQLSLADLAGYRAALSGRATADDANAADPPARVVFKDLWNRPDKFRGHRVTIQGRVVRIFRQGPVGSFPPLAEVWVTSTAGDPFCVVFPQPGLLEGDDKARDMPSPSMKHQGQEARATPMPELGGTVRFTGTFLKMVRYAAGDGARLAPLVVGDRLPVPSSVDADGARAAAANAAALRRALGGGRAGGDGLERSSRSPVRWVLGLVLAALAASILVRWHLRWTLRKAGTRDAARNRRTTSPLVSDDPPLEFIEPRDEV